VQVDQIDAVSATDPTADGGQARLPEGMLRRALVASDIAAAGAAWALSLLALTAADDLRAGPSALLGWALAGAMVTVAVLMREQLYLTRVWAVRALEVQRVGRGSLTAAVLLLVIDVAAVGPLTVPTAALAVALTCALVIASRAALLRRLHATPHPRADHRALLLADDVDEGRRVLDLLVARPRLGYQPVGFVSPQRPDGPARVPWLGTPADLPVLTRLTAATSVVVAGDSFEPADLSRALEQLQPLDVHTHLIAADAADALHVRVLPLSHRGAAPPVESSLTTVQRGAKRAFDLVAGGMLAVLALPVVAIVAAMLKVVGGGPVFDRDVCAGPRGEPVAVWRLRTRDLSDTPLAAGLGRMCNRLGIDRLPQLVNVLGGSMTLIGPTPRRGGRDEPAPVDMSAGLISLRHVETPEYPELGSDRRTDEFYIENWSIGLDVSILAASVSDLVWRLLRRAMGIRTGGTAAV
jgi:lipopolysaccharide/colanic/teichoic acid biosynthesis glycosyltransferase